MADAEPKAGLEEDALDPETSNTAGEEADKQTLEDGDVTSKAGQSSTSPKAANGEKNLLDMSESGELQPETELSNGPVRRVESTANNNNSSSNTEALRIAQQKIRELEERLEASENTVTCSASSSAGNGEDNSELLMELQQKLQSEMALKAEAENKLRLAQKQIGNLRTHGQEQTAEFEKYRGIQDELRQTLDSKEEAENNLNQALTRIQSLEKEQSEHLAQIEKLHADVVSGREALAGQDQELQKIREQRDEQERKEMSLTNRLNASKKKEAGKTNEAEKYEEELKAATTELEEAKQKVEELTTTKTKLQKELEETIVSSRQRQVQTEAALEDERKLNEDRKHKMKVFIEKKSDEIRQAKTDNESLQAELNQTTKSLSDLNIRWKQLHAQWVQSQTRNRELQRDLHRIKKDSENRAKVGDTLEMKLSKVATETEEHKNKRLAAKNELMTVLRTLESEREVSSRLRDSIKFTFTPKALSQQQLLNEGVADFETQLIKLSIRLRKPLPPTNDVDGSHNEDGSSDDWVEAAEESEGDGSTNTSQRQDTDTQRLIEKLNRETQQVSKCIMAMVSGIERLHLLLDAGGDRTCYTVISELIASSSLPISAAGRHEETAAMTGSPQLNSITSRDYV